MQDKLINILMNKENISGWLINDKEISSYELFFIKKDLDMNRTKEVQKTKVTIYKDFDVDGKKYKGSASTILTPSMEEKQISEKIDDLILGASFVKNEFYELVKPEMKKLKQLNNDFDNDEIISFIPKFVKAIFHEDKFENGKINSTELFLEKTKNTIINSFGVNESYVSYNVQIELVVDWKETGEEIEIIEILDFSDFDEAKIRSSVKHALEGARSRAKCVEISEIINVPIMLTKESVKEFLSYYISKSSAQNIYQKYSDAKLNSVFQGENVKGDLINIRLLPELKGSTASRYIDSDGIKLEELILYKDGVLKNYHGDNRFSQYLNITPTGKILNVIVDGGKKSICEMKKEPYLELVYFSDFQVNEITGDFGGEIRLGKYFDGYKIIPVTGGSISGNIRDVQQSMEFSSETNQIDNYICPQIIKLFGIK